MTEKGRKLKEQEDSQKKRRRKKKRKHVYGVNTDYQIVTTVVFEAGYIINMQ